MLLVLVTAAGCDLFTGPPDPPGPPEAVEASPEGADRVEVSWELGSGGADEVEVERAAGGGEFVPAETLPGTETTFVDRELSASTLYRYRLRACNSGGCSDFSRTARATTFAPVRVATQELPDAAVAEPYDQELRANGGDGSYTWTLVEGELPPGLSLSESGTLSGIPDAATEADFAVEVRSTHSGVDRRELTLRVRPAAAVEIRTSLLPPALQGADYSVALEAEAGSVPPEWAVVDGPLPAGLEVRPDGVFAGEPGEVGDFTFTLVAANGPETDTVELDLEVVPHRPESYDLTLMVLAPISQDVRDALTAARERWETVLTGDLVDASIPRGLFESGGCFGAGELVNGTSVDDMLILVEIEGVDGPGGVLGRAAPCLLRDDDPLPAVGYVSLDAVDVETFGDSPVLVDLVFHELGHTLGFGTLWEPFLDGAASVTPTFDGPEAVSEWHGLGGTDDVPVEGTGGPGTRNAHWRESEFGNEVMTGFLNQGANPLSRVTIGSMSDLGYAVDPDVADSYALPSPRAPAAPPPTAVGWDEVPPVEIRRLPSAEGS